MLWKAKIVSSTESVTSPRLLLSSERRQRHTMVSGCCSFRLFVMHGGSALDAPVAAEEMCSRDVHSRLKREETLSAWVGRLAISPMRANVRLLDYIVAASFITLALISLFLVCALLRALCITEKNFSIPAVWSSSLKQRAFLLLHIFWWICFLSQRISMIRRKKWISKFYSPCIWFGVRQLCLCRAEGIGRKRKMRARVLYFSACSHRGIYEVGLGIAEICLW